MDVPEELPVAGTVVLLRTRAHGMEVLLMRRPESGSFGGAWVFPGGRVEEGDCVAGATEVDDARRAAVRETWEEVGLEVDGLSVLSCWTPPAGIPRRIRTWFFLAHASAGEVRASEAEVVDHVWVTPSEALARHASGEWVMFPPTWVTLHDLRAAGDPDAALAAAGEPRAYVTQVDGTAFVWEGLRLETRELPWRLSA